MAIEDPNRHSEPTFSEHHQVASVALFSESKLLMGKRWDTGAWTLPGGHLEVNEEPHQAAWRELIEETGIVPDKIEELPYGNVSGKHGSSVRVYCFRAFCEMQQATNIFDPDHEIAEWRWIEVKGGLPHEVKTNLHHNNNVVLMQLGLL